MQWDKTANHFRDFVLPAMEAYKAAEGHLSQASQAVPEDQAATDSAGKEAIRQAANLALAFDGLVDRTRNASGLSRNQIYGKIGLLCKLGDAPRDGVLQRIEGIANAYRHGELHPGRHPIDSMDEVLAVGSGYGTDGYGVGKTGAPEVLIRDASGDERKFLGDAEAALNGWRDFLLSANVQL